MPPFTCPKCRRVTPEDALSPHGEPPFEPVVCCPHCHALRDAWDRERVKRTAWLEREGFGPAAFEGTQFAADDQRFPRKPKGPLREMPVVPSSYFPA